MRLGDRRKIIQVAALAVSNLGFTRILKTGFICPFLYCHGCPLAALGCPIGALQHFVIDGQFPFFTVGSLGVYGMIFGRAFCGWACPFGTLHDMISPTNRRSEMKTRNYSYVKYAILFLTVALTWLTLDAVFCKFCPSGSLFAAIPFRLLHPNFSEFGVYFYAHMFTLALTIILAWLIGRFWCRYLCPMGAIAGAFNKVSAVNISLNQKRCKECFVCLEACGMRITKLEDIGSSTDCILCGRCVEACPEKALSFKIRKQSRE